MSADDDFDGAEGGGGGPLLDPLGVLERRWKWMLGALAVGVAAAVFFSVRSEPRYAAEAVLLVAPQQISQRIVEPIIAEDALSRIDAFAAEVLSRTNLSRIIDELGLYAELKKSVTMGEIVNQMRDDVSISAVQSTQGGTTALTARAYAIRFEANDPEAAARVANQLAALFVETSFEERHRQHRTTTEFLRRELDRAEQELREQNRAIADFKERNRALLPDDLQANLARLDMLQNQRQSLSLQIAEAGTRMAMLASDNRSSGSTPQSKLEGLRSELATLRSTKTERHPDVLEVQRQIDELERKIGASGAEDRSPGALLRAAERTSDVLRAQLAATDQEIRTLDEAIGRMPAVQEELAALEEKGTILRENYLDFLRKVQDAELDESLLKAQQGERVSVLSEAEPPARPIRDRWKYLAFGLFASLGFAVVLGIALEFFDPVVVSSEQVARLTGLRPLGSVGRIR